MSAHGIFDVHDLALNVRLTPTSGIGESAGEDGDSRGLAAEEQPPDVGIVEEVIAGTGDRHLTGDQSWPMGEVFEFELLRAENVLRTRT